MAVKKNICSLLLLLVACSPSNNLGSVDLGNNALGFDNAEIDMRVIGATSLSTQPDPIPPPNCSKRPLPESCNLNASGTEVVSTSDIADPSIKPRSITSEIGFSAANLNFSFASEEISAAGLPDTFTLSELSGEFWAQDGIVTKKPSNPDLTLNIKVKESNLAKLVFIKGSCAKKICNYKLEKPETIITIEITEVRDFLDVFAEGSSKNTAGLTLEVKINDTTLNIPNESILTLILTNPKTLAKL